MNEIKNNAVNLCDSCTHFYPGCPAAEDEVVFGDGIGHDNICACSEYQPKSSESKRDSSDTISRQGAIDALTDDLSYYGSGDERAFGMSRAIGIIEKLPPAEKTQLSEESTTNLQPTCNQLATDCISRQAAIDAIEITPFDDYGDYMRVRELIEQLPSAQPQLEDCPIYGGMCGYPSNLCYECPRHGGAHEKPLWWTAGLQPFAQPKWIPVTKEEMFKAGYEGREIRFRVDGRLFAIRELAQ